MPKLPEINRTCAWEVRVSKKRQEDSFKAHVVKVCCLGKDPRDILNIDSVMVSEQDEIYCPDADNKAYSVYVIADNITDAKSLGVDRIKEYRETVEKIL